MTPDQRDTLAQIPNLARIFLLLKKLEEQRPGAAEEAIEWCHQASREEWADLDWRATMNSGVNFRMVDAVAKLTRCDKAAVSAIARAILEPNRPAMVLAELRKCEAHMISGANCVRS